MPPVLLTWIDIVTGSPTTTAVGVIIKSPRTKRAGDMDTDGVGVGLWLGVGLVVVGVGVGLGSEVNEGDIVDAEVDPLVVTDCKVFVVDGSLMVSVTA